MTLFTIEAIAKTEVVLKSIRYKMQEKTYLFEKLAAETR